MSVPCEVCGSPIGGHRGYRARTCSPACAAARRAVGKVDPRRIDGRAVEVVHIDPVAARHFITQRLDHQWPGAFFGGART